MILAGGHASASDRARFKREAEAVAALRHPNIVQIYAVGESGGLPYCALEFIEGGNLADHAAGKPLPPEQAATLVEQLARGVDFAHEHGIIHRDLKPANVLLTEDGTPKIADFGLAKKVDSATGPTATGAVLGTPAYMAPEQAGGSKAVGPAADTYALGAILYELLTGRPPFKTATALDTILQVISTEPIRPRAVNPKVPRDLETVTLKCLRKEPGKRYASAAELAEDLRRWRSGEPVTARPRGRGERLWRTLKRYPFQLVILGAATFFLFQTLLVPWLQNWRPRVAPTTVTRAVQNVPPRTAQTAATMRGDPPNPRAAPTVSTAATLERAKVAVVAIAAKRGDLATAGTGFMAVEPGIVVTTLSVLGMDHPLSPPPDRIQVLFQGPGQDLLSANARLLSVDRSESLACLQISAIGLPPPLALGRSEDVREKQQVWVAAFANLGGGQPAAGTRPTLKTEPATVGGRSVRHVYIEGAGLSPGGAVISADGRLVGVLMAGALSATKLLAAPSESVGWVLRERVQSLRLGQAFATERGSQLPVTARVADPLNRLWRVSLDVWTGDPGRIRPVSASRPQAEKGDGNWNAVPLAPQADDRAGPGEDRDFVGTLDLPPLPAGKVYWVQPRFHTSTGKEHWGDAVPLPDAGPPVERIPVRLALKPEAWATAERRLDLTTHRLMNIDLSGKPGVDDRTQKAMLTERSPAVGAGAAAKLDWRIQSYAIEGLNIRKETQQSFAEAVKGVTAEVDLAADGAMQAVQPNLSEVPVANRPIAQGVTRELTALLKAVNPALSGRDLKPGDSWPTESAFSFPSGIPINGIFHLTNTYIGSRVRAGRREAIIEVRGTMAPPAEKEAAGSVVGRTIGAYAVDIQTGQVVLSRIECDMILEREFPGGPNGKPTKTKVGMVLEIRFQRGPTDGPPIPAVMPLPNGKIDFRPFVPLPGAAPP